ncbi:MAG: hypothetical protein IIX93_14235 [Clostridia bacterium]|nr:hypothetical protein [Clostridia bacterium]
MERTQKQITGRAPVPYSWDNGHSSRARYETRKSDAYRVENVSSSARYTGKTTGGERIKLIALEIATVAILVLMLSMVVGKLNHIADIRDEQIKTSEIIRELDSKVSIAQTRLANLSSDDSIEFLAKTKLNMILPDTESSHVLSNVQRTTSDETHTAEAGRKP